MCICKAHLQICFTEEERWQDEQQRTSVQRQPLNHYSGENTLQQTEEAVHGRRRSCFSYWGEDTGKADEEDNEKCRTQKAWFRWLW